MFIHWDWFNAHIIIFSIKDEREVGKSKSNHLFKMTEETLFRNAHQSNLKGTHSMLYLTLTEGFC